MQRWSMKNWLCPAGSFFLLTVYCLLLTVFPVSCGTRGDPVAISPYEESGAAERSEAHENEQKEPVPGGSVKEMSNGQPPQAPEGLSAVFTGDEIILVWDEVPGRGVKFYRIYRSEGDGFQMIGEVDTPVFHDRAVVSGAKYFYKVSAVGQSESSRSGTVEVTAGGD
jgi:hypothetical protein